MFLDIKPLQSKAEVMEDASVTWEVAPLAEATTRQHLENLVFLFGWILGLFRMFQIFCSLFDGYLWCLFVVAGFVGFGLAKVNLFEGIRGAMYFFLRFFWQSLATFPGFIKQKQLEAGEDRKKE